MAVDSGAMAYEPPPALFAAASRPAAALTPTSHFEARAGEQQLSRSALNSLGGAGAMAAAAPRGPVESRLSEPFLAGQQASINNYVPPEETP